MKEQLLVLVEWAKYIPAFCELPLDDQVRVDTVCGWSGPWVGGSCCLPPSPWIWPWTDSIYFTNT